MIRMTIIDSLPKTPINKVPSWDRIVDFSMYNPHKYTNYLKRFDEAKSIQLLTDIRDVVHQQTDMAFIVDGEVKRENYIYYHCRHINGINFDQLVKKQIRNEMYKIWVPTVSSQLRLKKNYLKNDYNLVKIFASGNKIKMSIPGPNTLIDTQNNVYYKSEEELKDDHITIINKELKSVEKAGCRFVQIDEPLLVDTTNPSIELLSIVKCFKGLKKSTYKILNVCKEAKYSVLTPSKKHTPLKYIRLLKLINEIPIDAICLNYDDIKEYIADITFDTTKDIIIGIVKSDNQIVESIEELKNIIINILKYVSPQKLILAPNNGFGKLNIETSKEKLENFKIVVRQVNFIIKTTK